MKLGTVISHLKKIQKTYKTRDTPLWVILKSAFFYRKSAIFVVLQNTDKSSILIHIFNSFDRFGFSNVACNKHEFTFDDVSKIFTPGLFKISAIWDKDYDTIISVKDVINKTLLHDSNYFVDVVKLPKFGNFSISMKETIISFIISSRLEDIFLKTNVKFSDSQHKLAELIARVSQQDFVYSRLVTCTEKLSFLLQVKRDIQSI